MLHVDNARLLRFALVYISPMKLRRCASTTIEPRDTLSFDLADLMSGGTGAKRGFEWTALVPALGIETVLDEDELVALGRMSESQWRELDEIDAPQAVLARLIEKGAVVTDQDEQAALRARDDVVREQHWLPTTAAAQYFTRWSGIDADPDSKPPGYDSMRELVAKLGAPPVAIASRAEPDRRIALPQGEAGDLDALMARRVTCRNFDRTQPLPLAIVGPLLARVYAAQAIHRTEDGEEVVKKNHPSGGGLHPLENYLVIRGVEGLAPGLYHYHARDRALEPLPFSGDLDGFAHQCVGGQRYFAQAPVLVVTTARFERSFWKYRRHAKGYRALLLEAGHASQNLYLSATELGLGAFITAAINEKDIETALGLDPLREGVLCVNGFGYRGAERVTVEFDPLNKIWVD